ncbi:MAG: ferrochelatase [Flavobacteriaceae bacterium]|nr:MAG: ferrochelatase [Flavobacteriaceae bacterium]
MKGILLINLGSPESPKVTDVKKYLTEFLTDKYVIDMPFLLRHFLVRGIIIPKRVRNSAKLYKSIWTEDGSPLIVHSKNLTSKVRLKSERPVALGMRYGNPSIKDAIIELKTKGVSEITVLPLYPQYAMSTTQTVLEKVYEVVNEVAKEMIIKEIDPFYNNSLYINILSESIEKSINLEKTAHLLFSFHGIPERHIKKTDPTKSHCKIDGSCCITASEAHKNCYRHQCFETARLVAEKLNLKEDFYTVAFQSRLGKDPWLQPYTSATIKDFPSKGIDKIAVVTPAFVSDCLETIEEIGMEAKEDFLEAGGKEFHRIPCLNSDNDWADLIVNWAINKA